MPDREKPLKGRTKQDDEAAVKPAEPPAQHKQEDEARPDQGGQKDGLNQEPDREAR